MWSNKSEVNIEARRATAAQCDDVCEREELPSKQRLANVIIANSTRPLIHFIRETVVTPSLAKLFPALD